MGIDAVIEAIALDEQGHRPAIEHTVVEAFAGKRADDIPFLANRKVFLAFLDHNSPKISRLSWLLHELCADQIVTLERDLEDFVMKPYFSGEAPAAIGPYSHAIRTGNFLFCSGQTPLDAGTMRIDSSDIETQVLQAIRNLKSVLAAAGLDLSDVVKTNVYLSDMSLFPDMNAAYAKCFGEHRPARTTVAVRGLPCGALVEIECIAEFTKGKGE